MARGVAEANHALMYLIPTVAPSRRQFKPRPKALIGIMGKLPVRTMITPWQIQRSGRAAGFRAWVPVAGVVNHARRLRQPFRWNLVESLTETISEVRLGIFRPRHRTIGQLP